MYKRHLALYDLKCLIAIKPDQVKPVLFFFMTTSKYIVQKT